MIDPDQISLIIDNLLSNGLQAMPDGGRLTVRTRPVSGGVELVIEDTGLGIEPDLLERIFEPLFTTKSKGIGLGLALAKRLAEANGGRIRVESTLGAGSRFVIALGAGAAA